MQINLDSNLEKFLEILNQKKSSISLNDQEIPKLLNTYGFERNLKPFQIRDLKNLLEMNHGMNFSVPGGGKTSVSLALHTLLKNDKNINI